MLPSQKKKKKEKMYLSIFQGGNDFVNLLSLLRLGSTFFWDVVLSAMYISSFLNKRSERLRFRTAFGGDCHLPAQNSSRRQVTSVLQGTKTGGRLNGTISGELLNYMVEQPH